MNRGLIQGATHLFNNGPLRDILFDQPTHYYPLDDGIGVGSSFAPFINGFAKNAANPNKPLTLGGSSTLIVPDRRVGNILFQSAFDTTVVCADTTAYCWEGWFKLSSLAVTNKGILGSWDSNGAMFYFNGIGDIRFYHGATNWAYNLTNIWKADEWIHACMLWNGTTAYHMINGVIIGQQAIATSPGSSSRYSIGYYNYDSATILPGLKSSHVAYWSKDAMAANPMTPAKAIRHHETWKRLIRPTLPIGSLTIGADGALTYA